jgi:hypothetical protein
MFRSVLSLLLALPLLLPQGVCVCDLVQQCEACAECTECTECTRAVELEKATCGCHKHQPAEPGKTNAPALVKQHICHQNAHNSQQNEHIPCCPAKTGSVQWKLDPTPQSVQLGFDFFGTICHSQSPAVNSALLAPSFHLSSADQPLCLTLLTLRI